MARVLTVGHGTLAQPDLAGLLKNAGVRRLVDIRRYPGSRRHPHVAREAMQRWLLDAGVAYRWAEDLGGRRDVPPDSPDLALRNASFRGYAAHMRTPAFTAALRGILDEAEQATTVLLCSESLWWRCHRRLVADAALLLHDAEVTHLLHDGRLTTHGPTDGVRRDGERLVYDEVAAPTLSCG
ncbi:MAG: DUF488 domain-containing protein [Euzebyaceae bacterium]|nr:DUF488 domain-containing protein [Euzebyaceae bacterium]